ncbi:MAG: alpha-1,2-fucosyltransferase [Cycloclasticus sp.]
MIVKIIGGLGNQMFQYAFAYGISQKKGSTLKLDIGGFEFYEQRKYALNHYYIDAEIANRDEARQLKYETENLVAAFLRRLNRGTKPFAKSYYKEPYFQYDNNVFKRQGDVYFDGYWQSEKYFSSYRTDLLEHFSLKVPVHAKSKEYQQKILANQAVSLHIRRGDYVTNAKANAVHGTCGLDYYREAVSAIKKAMDNPYFFIFSDDMGWAKENIDFIDQAVFVELGSGSLDHEEMWLMSECQHNIIANSSFSWWGAWLNKNPNKIVIAPQRWFKDSSIITKDLIPEPWVCL